MFILLHTNDFHNHLTGPQAEYLRRLRQTLGVQGLLVDAGDSVASGNVTFRPWGEAVLKTMSEVGYDALTVGNREFHISRAGFHCKVGQAKFPILCANVRASDPSSSSDSDPPTRSHIVRELKAADGSTLRLVLFGLTVPMVTERMSARHVSAYLFDNPIHAAQRLVPQWKAQYQPDLMVALTHIGYPQDRKLAEAVGGIDLIIGGHSHTRLANGERVGETLIVQTGCFAHHVGRVDVFPAPYREGGERPQLRASLLELPKMPSNSEMEAQLQRLRQALSRDEDMPAQSCDEGAAV